MVIIEESIKNEMVGLRRCVEVHKMNEYNGTIEEMVAWVRSAIVFKRRATKRINKHIRNIMNTTFN